MARQRLSPLKDVFMRFPPFLLLTTAAFLSACGGGSGSSTGNDSGGSTGGSVSNDGSASTGGSVTGVGGSVNSVGGSVSGVGGSVSGVGGSVSGVGGSVNSVGGSVSGVGGSVSSTGGGVSGFGGSTQGSDETPLCGNGRKETGEGCDGADLGGATCASLSLGNGVLRCSSSCSLDTTPCSIACVPNCADRECGPDPACGTSCGNCEAGVCNASGHCAASCTPSCAGRECGSDPTCGTSCGSCATGVCNAAGRCVASCTPDCADRQCGLDPSCGTSCGTCEAGVCNASGQCVVACVPSCSGRECGLDPVCGQSCGSCTVGSCNQAGQCICTPDCSNRECGLDPVCGQSCGSCTVGSCNQAGQCICTPDCSNRACGPDPVCGQSCGSCTVGECSPQGTCERCLTTTTICSGGTCAISGEVTSHTVSGTILWNGSAINAGWRWGLLFLDTMSKTSFSTDGIDGGSTFSMPMYDGTYDVYFSLFSTSGTGTNGRTVWGSRLVQRGLVVSGPTTLNADLTTNDVTGTVRWNDRAPDATWSYVLRFVDTATGSEYHTDNLSGGSYTRPVYPGTYNVYFDVVSKNSGSTPLLWGRRLVSSNRTINAATTIDIALSAPSLSGTVTWNGGTLDNKWSWRLRFVDVSTGDKYFSDVISSTGAYSIPVYPGTYDVSFDMDSAYSSRTKQLVWGEKTVRSAVSIAGPTTLDLALSAPTVSGAISLNGAAVPNTWEWHLVFRDTTTGQEFTTEAVRGGSSYSMPMYSGTYDVWFDLNGLYSGSTLRPVWGKRKIASAVVVSGPVTLNVPLVVPTVSGNLSWMGQPMPSYWNWRLTFVDPVSGDELLTDDIPGASTYALPMFAGSYDVYFDFYSYSSSSPRPPFILHPVGSLSFDRNATLDLALNPLPTSGTVIWNGAAIDSHVRWYLSLEDVASGRSLTSATVTGPVSVNVPVYSGTYDIYFGVDSVASGGPPPIWGKRLLRSCAAVQ